MTKVRTEEALKALDEQVEEAELPALGWYSQGPLFDAVAEDNGSVYRTVGDVDWHDTEDGKQKKVRLVLARIEGKGLVELVRPAVAGKKPWSLTALGIRMDQLRNPERYVDGVRVTTEDTDGAEDAHEPADVRQVVVDDVVVAVARTVDVSDETPDEAVAAASTPFTHTLVGAADGTPLTVETVLTAESPLGKSGSSLVQEMIGKTRAECEQVLGRQIKATLFYLADRVGVKLPKSARVTDLVPAILGTSFPVVDDVDAPLAEGSALDKALRETQGIELAGQTRAEVEAWLTTSCGTKDLRHTAGYLKLTVPTSANKAKLVAAIMGTF
jgi:hypothetical protein